MFNGNFLSRLFYLFLLIVCIGLIILCALAPIALLLFLEQIPPYFTVILVAINFFAWSLLAIFAISYNRVVRMLDESARALDCDRVAGSLESKMSNFLQQMVRLHRAAYGLRLQEAQSSHIARLESVIQMIYRELPSRSVQFILHDEELSEIPQSFVAGKPEKTFHSKDFPIPESLTQSDQYVIEPIEIYGNAFGRLIVELKTGIKLKANDRQVLFLLSQQTAILLLDAKRTR